MEVKNIPLHLTPLFPDLLGEKPLIISGPCSAETREQVISTAKELEASGRVRVFRAGVWKPRTYPGGFEGVGEDALSWLVEARDLTGLKIGVEVASPYHVKVALAYGVDMVWIGARTTSNPFTLDEIAKELKGHDIAVMVKNPIAPDMHLWLGAIQRLNSYGITRLAAIHRGFGPGHKTHYRNLPIWKIPTRMRQIYPSLPFFCDPSHITGDRSLIAEVSQEAMDRCYDGLFIECHCRPDQAWSDSAQQITPNTLSEIIQGLKIGDCDPCLGEDIERLRQRIDEIDDEIIRLLGERSAISEEIGHWKATNAKTAFQSKRYEFMMSDRERRAERYGVSPELARDIFDLIHDASLKQQSEIIS
ncbi:chorismate mutase [Porphyromonas sp.]|uniref:chorismate mutase n=1 Tax=Porphyromonas sp. TaxID=1924944 RepID=UPI0026DAA32F|nr:chorismate mutase [Porphyromonas sp.]MDO4695775.1 chorismate mutase [Porphyromonas sp.]MDO4771546.1 chorismate mutase [Porphyromonas sp.]